MSFGAGRCSAAAFLFVVILGSTFPCPLSAQQTPPTPTPPKSSGVQEGTFEQGTEPQPSTQPPAAPKPDSTTQPAASPAAATSVADVNPKPSAASRESSQLKLGAGDLEEGGLEPDLGGNSSPRGSSGSLPRPNDLASSSIS